MAILEAVLLGGLSVELKYEVDPADDSVHWGDGANDHWGIVGNTRFVIELESLNDVEMDRLRIDAWDLYYCNNQRTP